MFFRARAPLRLGLAGGGTDLSPYCDEYGGAVLNATIDHYAYSTLEIGGHLADVEFSTADTGQTWRGETEAVMAGVACPLALHAAVYRRIIRDYNGGKCFPCRLITYCEAPPGSGLGSSSTLVVAMVKAFVEALALPLGEYDVAYLAFEIERLDCKLLGGRQDQYAATFGGFNFIEFHDNNRVLVNPLRIKNWILSELEGSLVLMHTGVSRSSAAIIEEQTRNVAASSASSMEAMHELKRDAFRMKEALLKGNIQGMAEILNSSWAAKRRTAQGVSNSMIDTLIDHAFAAGAKAAKVSGAGGGGFVLFVVDPVRRLPLIRELEKLPGRILSCSFTKRGTEGWRIE
jgi:D-glycero-alpha-D-manno-heptose-7-phosphate kinase